jgi:hypothetical protein
MMTLESADGDELACAILAAVADVLDERGSEAGLMPLSWVMSGVIETEFEGTHTGGRAHADAAALCAQWAKVLGLTSDAWLHEGFMAWTGGIGPMRLSLFAITNAERYAAVYPDDLIEVREREGIAALNQTDRRDLARRR